MCKIIALIQWHTKNRHILKLSRHESLFTFYETNKLQKIVLGKGDNELELDILVEKYPDMYLLLILLKIL